jgi:trehalose 6-phosphate phosphatase
MKSLLPSALSLQLAELGASQRLLVCTDYDGTLAPIAPRPEQAELLPGALNLLQELGRLPDTRVAVISGRPLDELRRHSGLSPPISLAGSHGAELPGCDSDNGLSKRESKLDILEAALAPICAPYPGAWIERKPFGLAVHIRNCTEWDAELVIRKLRALPAVWPIMQRMEGKAVIEFSLSRAKKGDAVRFLRDSWSANARVIYFGDDITDETVFETLEGVDVGVKVGGGPTRAHYRVTSESMVLNALAVLLQYRSMIVSELIKADNSRRFNA